MNTIIRIGMSTCGLAAGARTTFAAIEDQVRQRQLPATLQRTGCLGACHREPLVEVVHDGASTLYGPVTPAEVAPLLDAYFGPERRPLAAPWVVSQKADRSDYPFLSRQVKITTQLCGVIDPHSLDEYLAHDGYQALHQALTMTPDAIIQAIKDSHLRGRGGAGFPTGQKWEISRKQPGSRKFLICNADEGDPGAFMDRTMIEGDPHRVLEGMLIAGYAIGASRGYLYIRAEYPLAVKALIEAIDQARAYGVIGKNILGSGMDFDFVIKEGAGAFVCGEETALMRSIEGFRGMPTMRPPYPSEHGLWGEPTNINNVETYASVPSIILNGPGWFAGMGTARSGGTKAFALAGAIQNSGLVEIPIGLTLREMIYDIGGGCRNDLRLQGGAVGWTLRRVHPCRAAGHAYRLRRSARHRSHHGFRRHDRGRRDYLHGGYRPLFSVVHAGRIVRQMHPVPGGHAQDAQYARGLHRGSRHGRRLGTAQGIVRHRAQDVAVRAGPDGAQPVLTTLRYFGDEYTAHVHDKRCPAGSCSFGSKP